MVPVIMLILIAIVIIWAYSKRAGKTVRSSLYNIPHPGTDDLQNFDFDVDISELRATNVVGESHYQEALQAICGHRKEEGEHKIVKATVILEDDNPYSNQAVRIDIDGMTVGYLSRHDTPKYRQKLIKTGNANITVTCFAKVVGGWDRGGGDIGYYGVKVYLPRIKDLTKQKK
jgi:hypothetical protein